jgi:hypothetical protein
MGYLRCEACGAKALSAASQCPRCHHLFDLHDGRGQRAPLRTCSGCGIMHRKDRPCHWCGEAPATSRSPWVIRSAAAVAVAAVMGAGAWQYGGSVLGGVVGGLSALGERSAPVQVVASSSTTSTASAGPTPAPIERASPPPVSPIAAVRPGGDASWSGTSAPDRDGSLAMATTPSGVRVAMDSVAWQPAVARTWVNVRNDASRDGEVVGVISPESRALLGVGRAGWRRVRSPDVSGWVDPRLFQADSVGTRG